MFYIYIYIRPSLQSFDLFRTIKHDLYIDDSEPRKIDCGLKEIDADKYKRNYEVKGKAVNNLNDSLAFKWNTSEVTLVKGLGTYYLILYPGVSHSLTLFVLLFLKLRLRY